MVSFTKDSIIIKVESQQPFEDWQMINKSLSDLLILIMSNKDFPIHDYESFWFIAIKSALSELDITYEQRKQIENILVVA